MRRTESIRYFGYFTRDRAARRGSTGWIPNPFPGSGLIITAVLFKNHPESDPRSPLQSSRQEEFAEIAGDRNDPAHVDAETYARENIPVRPDWKKYNCGVCEPRSRALLSARPGDPVVSPRFRSLVLSVYAMHGAIVCFPKLRRREKMWLRCLYFG